MTSEYSELNTCNASLSGPYLQDLCSGSAFILFMTILETYIQASELISGKCERMIPVDNTETVYDYVIVGGGGAGAVVAARLSEISNWTVLLLEAGEDESAAMQIPSFDEPLLGSEIDWNYYTTNESHACLSTNGSCIWSSAKCLGGNTAHNGMIYLRGYKQDYDEWASMGNEGWSWEEVMPFFLKSEDNGEIERVGSEYHSTGGPLSVERFPYIPSFSQSIIAAGIEAGYGYSDDLNGDVVKGVSIIQATNKHGVRRSSSRAFLWPARNRSNLHVSLNSLVTKIVIEDGQAVGVEYDKNGTSNSVNVSKEVIVCAGSIRSPHLLMLSGIGPKAHLDSFGIEVVHDLPGVGENLHDQVSHAVNFTINEPDIFDNDWVAASEYLASQSGPLSSIGLSQVVMALPSSLTTSDYPDIQLFFEAYVASCAPGEKGALKSSGKRSVGVGVGFMRPKSRGRISLASKDPFVYPVIWSNYLDDSRDVTALVEAIQLTLALANTSALKAHNFTLSNPPLEACSNYTFRSDEYWACAVQQDTLPEWHDVGSCKMGPASDSMAVVDHQLRVHGVKGLRVADASIMPKVTSANTGAPTIMIAERAADFIKNYWGR
ncbi:glucose dehydrogenase [FAD, quinone]-like [Neodiprion fabricii]|uniref:glucose dehydrogenase [FAD, quinone]-like n=1 Tax=Neodiprion fabricii TaxID=2872261 RepID=UPI001ED947D9|nr:glucose dehydrogenase [FAD, quinone]-like [Neodiprion fabricii]XP_046433469.1 glucose dehydrogenase [FAD, quinone]-like [Neodiprion fabricii]